jgi:hypothetical protein
MGEGIKISRAGRNIPEDQGVLFFLAYFRDMFHKD